MNLELQQVGKTVGGETHIYPLDLRLQSGTINVLLGPTQAGKTSLMRLIAGLDQPDRGKILVDGKDVTGVPVRERKLAMVYQQFINYPGMTVFENIAAPLRIAGLPQAELAQRVGEMAEKLHISHLLQRLPGELSGGQQQRCALARALVKRAPLVLLDEPLVNLDYKLREELREELTSLFIGGDTTVVYATTEPQEALLLGGYTAVLDQGRLLQYGPTLAGYNVPQSTRVAAIFNDPPMNLLPATCVGSDQVQLADGTRLTLPGRTLPLAGGAACQVGVRCHHLRVRQANSTNQANQAGLGVTGVAGIPENTGAVGTTAASGGEVALDCVLDLAELSGSETYLHLRHGADSLVAQWPGVHELAPGNRVPVYLQPHELFLYAANGELISAPNQSKGA